MNGPRITCHRAVHRGIASIRNGRTGRSNNHNRCNRIIVSVCPLRPNSGPGNCRFVGSVGNNMVPNRCVPTISGNVRRRLGTNPLTNCPMMSVNVHLRFNSCRSISSSRLTFGLTTSVTFGRNFGGTGPILLRPVVGIRMRAPRRGANSIVNSLDHHHNVLGNRRSRIANIGVRTRMPLSRVFKCTARLHSLAGNHTSCAVRFLGCSRTPDGITRTMVRTHNGWTWKLVPGSHTLS